ncbi:TRAP transporter small permease subunit, partial [candidate division KSB3 bacterium]|nr:TRAP transporter small permease subunit [candidate division KSB3 bacterium]MBD3323947.1 TRAP transporter small permease subunit [candidate division KSB3 bacterium]
MKLLDTLNYSLNRLLLALGGVFLIGMILLTCGNILLRATWVPIRGTFELMGFFGAVVTAFALGYTQVKRGHIAVDVLIHKLSPKTQGIIQVINNTLCLA